MNDSSAAVLSDSVAEVCSLQMTDFLQLIVLDRTCGVPLHLQLRNSLRRIIVESLQDGSRVPAEELIARQLHISRATVRRALLDLTNDKLLERRRAVGTVVTKSDRMAKLSQMAVIMPDFESYALSIDSPLIGAIDRQRRKLEIDLRILRFKKGGEWESFERLIPFSPSEGGIILLGNPHHATEDLHRILTGRGYRTVNIDAYYPGYAGAYVGVCNRSGVELGLDYLHKLGHRNISFLVGEPEELHAVRERCRHFQEYAAALGLDSAHIVHGGSHYWDNSSEAATKVMPQVWKRQNRPTAIFAISDYSAFGCLSWLHRNGVKVPEDVSILSFDGTQLCRMVTPRLTTLVQPINLIAQEAFRILASPDDKSKQVFLSPTLRDGDSTLSI